jgi:glycosyltransferase involved in cell wall biosynthesis
MLPKMQSDGKLLSVVVPMHNEEPTVGNVISRLKVVLDATGFRHEIIVIDDFSRDKSVDVAKKQGATVYKLRQHMGKGYALRAGFAKAKGDIIATIDSDGSHLPEELPLLLLPVASGSADLVIGCRFNGGGVSATRRINQAGNRLFNGLIAFLTRNPICDSQSGYRVMSAQVLRGMKLNSYEYEIESEMLVKTARKHFRIREVPITFEQRTYGRSGVDPLVDGFKILLSILTAYVRS